MVPGAESLGYNNQLYIMVNISRNISNANKNANIAMAYLEMVSTPLNLVSSQPYWM